MTALSRRQGLFDGSSSVQTVIAHVRHRSDASPGDVALAELCPLEGALASASNLDEGSLSIAEDIAAVRRDAQALAVHRDLKR